VTVNNEARPAVKLGIEYLERTVCRDLDGGAPGVEKTIVIRLIRRISPYGNVKPVILGSVGSQPQGISDEAAGLCAQQERYVRSKQAWIRRKQNGTTDKLPTRSFDRTDSRSFTCQGKKVKTFSSDCPADPAL
jgi:hypothetical protein